MDHSIEMPNSSRPDEPQKKYYVTPTLADLGSVTEITKGATGAGVDNVVFS